MDAKQRDNLRRCLAYMAGTEEERAAHVQAERDRIAKMLRTAKIRVKANKAAHGGIYCPDSKARARTRKATTNRKIREQIYRDMGLVKVKGAVTGHTYWE